MNMPSIKTGLQNIKPSKSICKRTTLIAFILLALSGCASMSESECLSADWYLIGHEDGTKGQSTDSLRQHRKACADYGVSPNLEQYQAGYAEGIPIYCTERNGFATGKRGSSYSGVCPRGLEREFLSGYNQGRELYLLYAEINRMERLVSNKQSQVESEKESIKDIKLSLIADETTSIERVSLLEDLEELQVNHGTLESEIRELELQVANMLGQYEMLNQGAY